MKLTFKKDNYSKARGSYSRLINVYCRKCNNLIAKYQKDGPGNLRRMYLDRITSPKELVNLQEKSINKIQTLKCKKCKEMLGTPYIYEKENRKAFKLYQDAIIKKVTRLK
jgi:hypothetical protein